MSRSERRDRLENDMRVAMGALFVEMDNLRAEVERVARERDEARAQAEGLMRAARDSLDNWDWWWVDPYDRELPDIDDLRVAVISLPTPEEADRAE